MAQIFQDINLNGNDAIQLKFNPITTPEPVPADEFAKIVTWDGTGAYPEFTSGEGIYSCDTMLNWNKILDANDVDVSITGDTVVKRDSNGQIQVPLTPSNPSDLISLSYLNTKLASGINIRGTFSQTGPSHYPKANATAAVGGLQIGSSQGAFIAKGDSWRITGGGFIMGQPTGEHLENGDMVIALVDMAGNNDSDWIVISKNFDQATTTDSGIVKYTTAANLVDRITASGVTDSVMTPERYAVDVHQGFTATTTEYGTVMVGESTDVLNRTNALANTMDALPTNLVVNAMDNLIATGADAGSVMLATSTDVLNRTNAALNTSDTLTPNTTLQAIENITATIGDAGSIILAEMSDVVDYASLSANTTDVMTPKLMLDAINAIVATETNPGFVKKYEMGDLANTATAANNDDDYMSPFGMYTLMQNSNVTIHTKFTISGLGGTVTVNDTTVADIASIKCFDSAGEIAFVSIDSMTNVGSNVEIVFSTTSAVFSGAMSVIYLWS